MVESTSPIHTYNACLQSTTKEDCIDRYRQAYLYAKQTDDAQYLVNLNIALLQKRRIRNGGEGLETFSHSMRIFIRHTQTKGVYSISSSVFPMWDISVTTGQF